MARRSRRRVQVAPAQSQDKRLRNGIIIGSIVLGLIGLGYLLYLSLRGEPPIPGVIQHPNPSRGHDNDVEYAFGALPPHGGLHADIWQNCGIYDEPVPGKNAVHSLEHGAVWLTYQPELAAADVMRLREKVRGQSFVLMSPWPDQRSPIVLTAWGVQLEVDSASDGRIEDFVERFQQGPQTPERGATCSSGVGTPIQG